MEQENTKIIDKKDTKIVQADAKNVNMDVDNVINGKNLNKDQESHKDDALHNDSCNNTFSNINNTNFKEKLETYKLNSSKQFTQNKPLITLQNKRSVKELCKIFDKDSIIKKTKIQKNIKFKDIQKNLSEMLNKNKHLAENNKEYNCFMYGVSSKDDMK